MAFKFAVEHNGTLAELPAPTQMFLLSEGITILTAVALAAELRISDILANGPKSSGEIAEATATNADSLYRLLRLLTAFGIFSESEHDRFAQTPLSELLQSSTAGSLRPWVRMIALPVWAPIWADAMHSLKTGEPTFKRSMGVELFDYLAAHPPESEIFNEAMSAFGQGVANAVAQAYDFSDFRKIVDVGGGHGILISKILQANPHQNGILFDLPHVTDGVRNVLVNARVADRCEIAAGNFFESVPAGGDAYVLSWIIHDWPRNQAVMILRNCRRAMNQAGRLLLVETVIPAPDEPHSAKIMDFVMLVGLGGQERTEHQYKDLLCEAGFELRRVVPTASPMSVIEAVPS